MALMMALMTALIVAMPDHTDVNYGQDAPSQAPQLQGVGNAQEPAPQIEQGAGDKAVE